MVQQQQASIDRGNDIQKDYAKVTTSASAVKNHIKDQEINFLMLKEMIQIDEMKQKRVMKNREELQRRTGRSIASQLMQDGDEVDLSDHNEEKFNVQKYKAMQAENNE